MIINPEEVVASYIIQVNLVFKPGVLRLGSFNLWKKAGQFGSADELMKFCPATGCKGFFTDSFELTELEEGYIPEANRSDPQKWPQAVVQRYLTWLYSPVLCSECGAFGTEREYLPDSYGFNLTYDVIAKRLAEFYQKLSGDADVLMVRMKKDAAFQKAREELYSSDKSFKRYKRLLDKARDRDTVFYPLKRIIKDTSAGASLEKVFQSFLEA